MLLMARSEEIFSVFLDTLDFFFDIFCRFTKISLENDNFIRVVDDICCIDKEDNDSANEFRIIMEDVENQLRKFRRRQLRWNFERKMG